MNKRRWKLFIGVLFFVGFICFLGWKMGTLIMEKKSPYIEETQIEEDTIVLKFYDKNISNVGIKDPVIQKIEEKTGVQIEIMEASDNYEKELELMLGVHSYPDIVLLPQGEIINRYIEAGALLSLDSLIEKYGKNISEMYGEILNRSKYTDGKIYWFANWYGEDLDASSGVLMRKDLLEKIVGVERAESNEPFTFSEYRNILKEFKEKFPSLEGHESIALELDSDAKNYEMPMKAIYGLKTYGVDEHGKLSYLPNTTAFQQACLELNRLYRMGLLDKEWIINKTEQWEKRLSDGYVFSTWASYWDTYLVNQKLAQKYGKDAQFFCYKVVADHLEADQTTYNGRNSLGWDVIGITKNCKNPEAAIKVLDFLASEEGQYLQLWGIEGESWNLENGIHVPDEEFLQSWKADSQSVKEETGVRRWLWMIKNGNGSDGTPYDLTEKYIPSETTEFANATFGESDYWDTAIFTGLEPSVQSEWGLKWIKIQNLYEQNFGQIICASTRENAIYLYGKMLEDMRIAGLSECENYITEQYQKRLESWN